MLFCQIDRVFLGQPSPDKRRVRNDHPNSPAASLRPAIRLPAARVLLGVSNYLIYRTLSAIGTAISGVEPRFLPAVRKTLHRVARLCSVVSVQLLRGAAVQC